MSEQRHVIKRQVIELKIRKSVEAPLYQAELSRIYRQRIIPLIDRCCNELGRPDRLYRLESLDLDLGPLDLENLEEDFTARVETALRRELVRQIDASENATDRHSGSPEAQSQLELFAFFARTGSLPWWADTSRPRLLAENLEQLRSESPQALSHLLQELVREPQARRRIANQYTDEQLAALCGVLVPSYAQVFEHDLHELLQTAQGVQIRPSLWNNLLEVAGASGEQYAGLAALYQAVLKRVVIDLGAPGSRMMTALYQAIQEGRISLSHPLTEVIVELAGVEVSEPIPASRIPSERLADRASENPPDETCLEPGTVAPQNVVPAQTTQASSSGRNDPSPEAPVVAPQGISSARPRQELPAGEKAIDTRFSDADELSIDNAGLVILWPFLVHFFTRLDLLDKDRRFLGFAAQQRAVGLLQIVAAQDPAPPEYLLPLNKLLCGMELTEVFDFGPPLLDLEARECTSLIEAVIAQAPILHDMSVDGFRGTFLLRPGLLTTRDGMWLLHVERQTYDIVLERFPWSWEWVKLPWMEAPLRVDW